MCKRFGIIALSSSTDKIREEYLRGIHCLCMHGFPVFSGHTVKYRIDCVDFFHKLTTSESTYRHYSVGN